MLIKNLEVCIIEKQAVGAKSDFKIFSPKELAKIKEIGQKIAGEEERAVYTHNLIDEWPEILLSSGVFFSEDGKKRLETDKAVIVAMRKNGCVQFFGGKKGSAGEIIKSVSKDRQRTNSLDHKRQQNGGQNEKRISSRSSW
ncbi:MAG TPA: hypothetical protein P5089_00775 [Candidatus Portnoybacteria bacterium]|nr:hypothetical protein [Candidatus Portnoybacteria bacterium]